MLHSVMMYTLGNTNKKIYHNKINLLTRRKTTILIMNTPKFRAYIKPLKMMLYGIDVFGNGTIGITHDMLESNGFFKLHNVDEDYSAIRDNGTDAHIMTVNTGEEYVYFDTEFELMAHTGYNDINGKGIYEGDLLYHKEDENDIKYVLVEWVLEECRFTISAYGYDTYTNENSGEEYNSFISMIEDNWFIFGTNEESKMKVIGNIYENSELTK